MKLSSTEIARMIDLSAVRAEDDDEYIHLLVESAKKYGCAAVFTLPSRIPLAGELLKGREDILIGGAVGFPSGGDTTPCKVFQAKELIGMGCLEIDMVINIGKLVSGRNQEVLEDIHAVKLACADLPLKVILECHYLNEAQIRKGCDLAMEAKANWVKTGTGWAPGGTTLADIELMKAHVGDRIAIKAAGGIRDLKMVCELYRRGVRRFGVGLKSSQKILEEAFALPGGTIEF